MTEADEPQALYEFAVLQLTLKLLEEQRYGQCFRLILVNGASNPNSDFYVRDKEVLRCQPLSMLGLKQIVRPHSVQDRLCTIAHRHYLAGDLGIA